MSRTDYTRRAFFHVKRPDTEVTFVLPTPENPCTSIKIPCRSKWRPSPHWHERYVEIFRVIQGRVRLIIRNEEHLITPQDGEIAIQPFTVHEFMRADIDAAETEVEAGDVIVEERMEPADGLKEVFFRNLFGAILDRHNGIQGKHMFTLQLAMIERLGDNWNVIVPGPLSWYITHGVNYVLSVAGRVAGLRPWYDEYTPLRLRHIAAIGATRQKAT